MTLRILAIGDSANLFKILGKFVKKSEIHIINFPLSGAASHTYDPNVEFFKSTMVNECVKRINEIKDNFDLCITMGVSAVYAYLAGLNYVIYFVGDDIRLPFFKKNATLPYFTKPLHSLNFLERSLHKKVIKNAIACITMGEEFFNLLKKHRKDAIRLDRIPVDSSIFNEGVKPVNLNKKKFTFLSPSRFGINKGFDLLWDALPLCKSDFEILQVEWYDERTDEERRINHKLMEKRPPQVKIIPLIKYDEMANYIMAADAVIGDLRSWSHKGGIEREAAMCKKPVISFQKPDANGIIDGKMLKPPYYPNNRDPKELANLIDKLVLCQDFRESLTEEQHNYIKRLADPEKAAAEWDNLFEDLFKKYKSIKKNSDTTVKVRNFYFQIINRLYLRKVIKIKKLLKYNENKV